MASTKTKIIIIFLLSLWLATASLAAQSYLYKKFQFVAELEPGRMMIVRQVGTKYFAALYETKKQAWLPLQEISHQEFKRFLEDGLIPVLFKF